jgi:hypothetical protein
LGDGERGAEFIVLILELEFFLVFLERWQRDLRPHGLRFERHVLRQ